MSMGYSETYNQVINEETLRKAVGDMLVDTFKEKFNAFVDSHEKEDINAAMNSADFSNGVEEDDCNWQAVAAAYKELCDAFQAKTDIGLSYTYFRDGQGDCYDDIEAGSWEWTLNDADVWIPKKLTEKAQKFISTVGPIDTDQRFSCYS